MINFKSMKKLKLKFSEIFLNSFLKNELIKKSLIILLDILILIVLLYFIIFLKDYNYKSKEIYLSYPSIFLKDINQNNYIVDNSSKRIIKADSNYKLKYIINSSKKSNRGFYQVVDIAVDNEENLYVLNSVLDDNGFYINRISVIKYNKYGKFDKLIYERNYKNEELSYINVQRSLYKNLIYKKNMLYFFLFDNNSVKQYEYNIDLEKLNNKEIFNFEKANLFIFNIFADEKNEYYIATKRGEIYEVKDGKFNLIYKEPNSLPYSINKIDDTFVLSDLLHKNIVKIYYNNKEFLFKTSFNDQSLENYTNIYNYYYNIKVSGRNLLLTSEKFCIEVDIDGKIIKVFDYILNKKLNIIKFYLFFAIAIILVIIFIFLLINTYKIVMNKKFSIFFKMLIIFIPLIIISITLTSFIIYKDLIDRYESLLNNKIATMIQMVSKSINSQDLNKLNSPEDFMSEPYVRIKEKILTLLNFNKDEWNKDFYFALHKKIDNYIYSIMYLNDDITVKTPFDYLNETNSIYTKSYEGEIAIEKSVDQWGNWFYGVGPIYDDNQNVMGLVEIGKDNIAFEMKNRELIKRTIRNVILLTLFIIFFLFLILYYLLNSIKRLKEGTQMIEKGVWGVQVKVKGRDEIEDLANSFNKMVSYINKYLTEITNLNKTYFKFVPEEFLKFLNKQNITDFKLGDQVQKEMTIMFVDIVGFTKISEKLSPSENFNFLNSYLSIIGPLVRKNSGFIDKYMGDGIMALYPNYAGDAIETAIEIRKTSIDFNKKQKEKGLPEIDVRFGIHTGLLMLGILGEEQRIDSTVISDNVNLASRLEGLTRKFDASIIISEFSYDKLINKEIYVFRYLGKVRVKGKENPVKIFEVLDGLKKEDKIKRIKYLEHFHIGVKYFENYDYNKALNVFKKIEEKFPDDKATNFYIEICNYYLKENIKENVLIFYEK
ncbi:MAG: HAMP domain-containing protein [Spirochaetes bacterium]|nr:HAMP domain-containing protein [Spirochaetota bacterium]